MNRVALRALGLLRIVQEIGEQPACPPDPQRVVHDQKNAQLSWCFSWFEEEEYWRNHCANDQRSRQGANRDSAVHPRSVTAAKRLGRRAVLIVGKNACHRPASLPDGVIACDYAPFSELFPRAAVIVHAGGVGTTGQAMRSGRPMLIVPYAHDQFDNAARVARVGIARTIPRPRYTLTRVAAELRQLLDNPMYAERTSGIAERLRQEDGVRAACDALEKLL